MSTVSHATVDAANAFIRTVRDAGATATIITDRSSVTIGAKPEPAAKPITDYPDERADVPHDDAFDGADFLESIQLTRIGNALIRRCPEFGFLTRDDDMVTFVWKRQGGQSGGRVRYGQCQKASGLVKFFAECEYVIWIAADHVRQTLFTNLQLEALLYHELLHCGYELDKNGDMKLMVRGHDDELFYAELRRYGTWKRELERTGEVYAQLGLAAEGGV